MFAPTILPPAGLLWFCYNKEDSLSQGTVLRWNSSDFWNVRQGGRCTHLRATLQTLDINGGFVQLALSPQTSSHGISVIWRHCHSYWWATCKLHGKDTKILGENSGVSWNSSLDVDSHQVMNTSCLRDQPCFYALHRNRESVLIYHTQVLQWQSDERENPVILGIEIRFLKLFST